MVFAKRVRKMESEREINMPLTGLFWLASVSLTQQHMHTNVHISYTFPIHQDFLYTIKQGLLGRMESDGIPVAVTLELSFTLL